MQIKLNVSIKFTLNSQQDSSCSPASAFLYRNSSRIKYHVEETACGRGSAKQRVTSGFFFFWRYMANGRLTMSCMPPPSGLEDEQEIGRKTNGKTIINSLDYFGFKKKDLSNFRVLSAGFIRLPIRPLLSTSPVTYRQILISFSENKSHILCKKLKI